MAISARISPMRTLKNFAAFFAGVAALFFGLFFEDDHRLVVGLLAAITWSVTMYLLYRPRPRTEAPKS